MQTCHPINYDDPRVIILDRGAYNTCTVILKGACITSWRIENEEQLFMSRVSKLDDYFDYRGGISLVFPQYDKWQFGRTNGFAKSMMWRVKRGPDILSNGDVYLELYLPWDSFTKACWNYEFELCYSIRLKSRQLETRMVVINTSPVVSFEFNLKQNWYFRLANAFDCSVSGLKDGKYIDRMSKEDDADKTYIKQTDDEFIVGNCIDRVYRNTPSTLYIHSKEDNKSIRVVKTNLPDLCIWNPGYENGKMLCDLDADEVKHFLTINSGYIHRKIVLGPNSFWTASQMFEIIKSDPHASKHMNFMKIIEAYC